MPPDAMIRPRSRSTSRLDRGDLEGRDALPGQARQRRRDQDPRRTVAPALPHGEASADIERDDDSPGSKCLHEVSRETRSAESCRPDHDPARAGGEGRRDSRPVAQPARHLARRPLADRRQDLPNHLALALAAAPGSVEIDEVEPARAGRHETAGDLDRILAEDGLRGEVTAQQPDHPAAAQVDCRQDLEVPRPRPD
jgi:hypothetical protein